MRNMFVFCWDEIMQNTINPLDVRAVNVKRPSQFWIHEILNIQSPHNASVVFSNKFKFSWYSWPSTTRGWDMGVVTLRPEAKMAPALELSNKISYYILQSITYLFLIYNPGHHTTFLFSLIWNHHDTPNLHPLSLFQSD